MDLVERLQNAFIFGLVPFLTFIVGGGIVSLIYTIYTGTFTVDAFMSQENIFARIGLCTGIITFVWALLFFPGYKKVESQDNELKPIIERRFE